MCTLAIENEQANKCSATTETEVSKVCESNAKRCVTFAPTPELEFHLPYIEQFGEKCFADELDLDWEQHESYMSRVIEDNLSYSHSCVDDDEDSDPPFPLSQQTIGTSNIKNVKIQSCRDYIKNIEWLKDVVANCVIILFPRYFLLKRLGGGCDGK